VGIDLAELVVRHLADEAGAAAEHRDARRGVAGRAAADLAARAHLAVKPRRLLRVDQPHRALVEPLGGEEGVVGGGDDVDDGVADAEDVEASVGHGGRTFVLWEKAAP
jgi:hypothetical protein